MTSTNKLKKAKNSFCSSALKHGDAYRGYVLGATEQKAIDDELLKRVHKGVIDKAIKEKRELIEKACEWLKKYCGMNESGLVQFRKAMEE